LVSHSSFVKAQIFKGQHRSKTVISILMWTLVLHKLWKCSRLWLCVLEAASVVPVGFWV